MLFHYFCFDVAESGYLGFVPIKAPVAFFYAYWDAPGSLTTVTDASNAKNKNEDMSLKTGIKTKCFFYNQNKIQNKDKQSYVITTWLQMKSALRVLLMRLAAGLSRCGVCKLACAYFEDKYTELRSFPVVAFLHRVERTDWCTEPEPPVGDNVKFNEYLSNLHQICLSFCGLLNID